MGRLEEIWSFSDHFSINVIKIVTVKAAAVRSSKTSEYASTIRRINPQEDHEIGGGTIDFNIMKFSPLPCYFLPISSRHSPEHCSLINASTYSGYSLMSCDTTFWSNIMPPNLIMNQVKTVDNMITVMMWFC